jgi:hypothetical protein
MTTQREIDVAVTRCVALMATYQESSQRGQTAGAMAAGVQNIAGHVNGFHLGVDALDEQILHPVEAELDARYGPAAASAIYAAFLKAFEEGYIFNFRAADPPPGQRTLRRSHTR